jgi:glucose-6-phosphate isomerase
MNNIDLKNLTPDVRYLSEMESVIYDKDWFKTAENFELYYMYRKVKQENGLNHNVTIIPPKMLGQEFVKTKGHIHIGPYQEIYTVEEGEALYLMQKTNGDIVEDVYVVKAQKGESIIIPPYYGHITINPSDTESLRTGDWTSENCKSDYSLFEKLNGACWYYAKNGWVKNPNYKLVPELRFQEPLKSFPDNLDFLK